MTTLAHAFPTAYTPLESLLLFQALRVDGVQSISFVRISDQLKNVPLIRNDPNYDSGRLDPDALRDLYLHLLKEEAKQELEQQEKREAGLLNGDLSPTSRKRKLASPTLPTVQEAVQHSHLIPQLVSRLYARYRDSVLRKVREQERQYASLSREIEEINAGSWDERLLQSRNAASDKSFLPPVADTPRESRTVDQDQKELPQPAIVARSTLLAGNEGAVATDGFKGQPTTSIHSVSKSGSDKQRDVSGRERPSSGSPFPSTPGVAPQSPQVHVPLQVKGQVPPPMTNNNSHMANQASLASHRSPYSQPMQPRTPSLASPQQAHSTLPRQASAPQILPPLAGTTGHTPSASPQLQGPPSQPSGFAQHQYHAQSRPHGVASPVHDPAARAWPPASQPGYYQPSPFNDQRVSAAQHPHPPGHYNQSIQPTPYLPQIQNTPSDPSKASSHAHAYPQPNRVGSTRPPPASYSASAPNTAPRPAPRGNPHLVSSVIAALATPTRQPLWKSDVRPSTHERPTLQPRPDVEPLSPTLGRRKTPRRELGNEDQEEKASIQAAGDDSIRTRTSRRLANARDRSPHSTSSVAGDSVRTRTRSHSVSTAVGVNTSSEDRPGSRSNVKLEPSTPAEDGDLTNTAPPTASASSGRLTRQRRGTLQSSTVSTFKRKRQESPSAVDISGEPSHLASTPPPRSDKVIATRNFAKIASAILNDINSHKHAYHFEKPVRDRDAAGYSEIVYAPQNLKAIRTALSAGHRIVTAAAASAAAAAASSAADSPTASAGDSGGSAGSTSGGATVELERSLDVLPPKAIVNAAQLEKEVMRMFANAFMFNPGEDGMAGDTREFFKDVEVRLSEWRSTEREILGGAAATAEDDDRGRASGKRRKV